MAAHPPIRSRDNATIKQIAALARSTRERRALGLTVIDGAHLVASYEAANGTAQLLAVSARGLDDAEIGALFERAPARRRVVIADDIFAAIAAVTTPSGIIAIIPIPSGAALPERLGDAIVLDRIQEPGNAGSMLRTALAANIRCVVTTPGTVDMWAPKVLRGAMGAHFGLAIHESIALADIAARAGAAIIATGAAAPAGLYATDLRGPNVWLFGNEGAGLDQTSVAATTRRIRIPMSPGTESLNVAAAAAICLYEQVRQRTFA